MADQYAVAQRQRAALLRGDRAVSRTVLDHYFLAWKSIRDRLTMLTRQIEQARAAGEEPSAGWLAQQDRLLGLQRHVSQEVSVIASRLAPFLTGEQATWAQQAIVDTQAQVDAAKGAPDVVEVSTGFNRINVPAVQNIIGFLSDGSPLQELLGGLGPDAAKEVGEALVQGVISGQNPRTIARGVRRAFSGNMARALLVSRDAVLGAYRETAHQTYLANADVVETWTWMATLDGRGRTCASCVAMHGTVHPLKERLRSHPACRCCQIPNVTDEPPPAMQTGEEWFYEQPEDIQRTIVGPKKFAALQAGDIALKDLSITRRSARWGSHTGEATYAEALANAKARRTTRPTPPPVVTPVTPTPVVPKPALVPPTGKTPGEQVRETLAVQGRAYSAKMRAAQQHVERSIDARRAVTRALLDLDVASVDVPYNDPAYEATFQRLKAALVKADVVAQAALTASDRVNNGRLAAMRKALIPAPVATPTQQLSVTVAPQRGSTWTAEERKGIKTGAAFLDSITQWGPHEGQLPYVRFREVPTTEVQRSYNLAGDVYLGAGDARSRAHSRGVATVVHELGHTLEHASLSVQQERRAFLLRRTQGDALEPMKALYPNSNYKATEYTRKDKFKDAYTGMDYSHLGGSITPPNTGGHTSVSEVISMGVQHLYEDPEAFARDDPDFFDFTISILRRP